MSQSPAELFDLGRSEAKQHMLPTLDSNHYLQGYLLGRFRRPYRVRGAPFKSGEKKR